MTSSETVLAAVGFFGAGDFLGVFFEREVLDADGAVVELRVAALAADSSGQFAKALKEFNELIKEDPLRIVAAKNIVRCMWDFLL